MTPEQAQQILHSATWNDDGTFILLRLGEDPGKERLAQLRLALHVLWLYWKNHPALPFDISEDAAMILRMSLEAKQNLNEHAEKNRLKPVLRDLDRLDYSAFCLLIGPRAEQDLGRNGERWIA
jgi:hypothetical protein